MIDEFSRNLSGENPLSKAVMLINRIKGSLPADFELFNPGGLVFKIPEVESIWTGQNDGLKYDRTGALSRFIKPVAAYVSNRMDAVGAEG